MSKLKVTAIVQETKQTVREPCFTEQAGLKPFMFTFPVITVHKWSEAKAEKLVQK